MLLCLSLLACSTKDIVRPVIPQDIRLVDNKPPKNLLLKHPLPSLKGTQVNDYVTFGIECKAVVEKEHADKDALLQFHFPGGSGSDSSEEHATDAAGPASEAGRSQSRRR